MRLILFSVAALALKLVSASPISQDHVNQLAKRNDYDEEEARNYDDESRKQYDPSAQGNYDTEPLKQYNPTGQGNYNVEPRKQYSPSGQGSYDGELRKQYGPPSPGNQNAEPRKHHNPPSLSSPPSQERHHQGLDEFGGNASGYNTGTTEEEQQIGGYGQKTPENKKEGDRGYGSPNPSNGGYQMAVPSTPTGGSGAVPSNTPSLAVPSTTDTYDEDRYDEETSEESTYEDDGPPQLTCTSPFCAALCHTILKVSSTHQ